MKKFTKSFIACSLAAGAMLSSGVQAEQKVGAVNVQGVFQAMPQAATIQQTIAAEFKDQTEEVNRLEKDIKYYLEKNQRDAATMSASEKTELEEKIIGLRDEYAQKAQPLQQAIQRRMQEEQGKLIEIIRQSVDKVAAAEKYDVILNANAVAFINPDYDISELVIKQISSAK